jgi:long-chain acyl-CoA synthetase
MYEAQLPSDWTYILNDSDSKVVFCATQDIYNRVKAEVAPNVPVLQEILCLDAPAGEPHAFLTAMESIESDAEGNLIIEPKPDDLANLIYTSGTTGKPKGVELTHSNFTSNVKGAARSMVEDPREFVRYEDTSLAFLPWAHSYGQTCELWMSISHGASMGICRGVPMILEDLQLVKPTVLFAVPTLYKKIYDGVHNLIEGSSPLRKKLMKNALAVGHAKVDADHGKRAPLGFLENFKFKALDKIVLNKIRARFGGNLRHGFVAGAACPAEVLSFMDAIGIPVCEGYGLTETSPIISINTPEQRLVGSVGRTIGQVKVYIVDPDGKEVPYGQEGEICCVGPNVMKG